MTGGFTPPTQGDTSTATSKVKLGTLDCLPCDTDQDQNQEADWLSPLLRPEKAEQTCRLLCEMANNYLWIEGIPFPTSTIGDLSSLQDQFVVRDEDVITLAYPKSVAFGSWFDHIHGWLQMKGKENSLLISYEELHQDTRASVERVSQFLGMKLSTQFSPQECVLPGMKDNKMSNFSLVPDTIMDHSKGHFVRKGITGDWKNHFTVAQREACDKVYREKMAGLPQGLFPWD